MSENRTAEPNDPLLQEIAAFAETLYDGEDISPAQPNYLTTSQKPVGGSKRSRLPIFAAAAAVALVIAATVALASGDRFSRIEQGPVGVDEKVQGFGSGPAIVETSDGAVVAEISYTGESQELLIATTPSTDPLEPPMVGRSYIEQAVAELENNDVFWETLDLSETTKGQWLGDRGLTIRVGMDIDSQAQAQDKYLDACGPRSRSHGSPVLRHERR